MMMVNSYGNHDQIRAHYQANHNGFAINRRM